MQKSKIIKLTCAHCGHEWETTLKKILEEAREVIYRGAETQSRYVTCPNCGRDVKVEIPVEWLDE